MSKFVDMEHVKRTNKLHGYSFFDASTLRFFDSHVGRDLINGRYFITSEQFHGSNNYHGPRLYTVRRVEDNGSINTIGDFQQFKSNATARRYAEKLADTPSPCANCRKSTYNRNFTCDECQGN